ncbi:MAG: hypothetical protein KAR42_13905 [candidate division Zixibacteria bacterium]|nr:hypothetical protein [candidate division Zixibacteria bacterium]
MRRLTHTRTILLWMCVIVCFLIFFSGCSSIATQKAFYEPISAELRAGHYDSVVVGIENALLKNKFKEKDRFLYYMDAGLANHYASRFDTSSAKLSKAEDAADELFTKSITRAAASLILNDNILEYAGEDYEIVYANLIKALNYIAQDKFDDAFVEIKRANHRLELLENKYREASDILNEGARDDTSRVDINYKAKKVRFNNSAFARYLSMHIYAAEGKPDDAQLDYDLMRRAFIEQKHIYPFEMPVVRFRSKDKEILSVVALLGNSPVKDDLNLRIRTDSDLDLVQILYDEPGMKNSEYGHIPMAVSEDYYFKFSLPQIVSVPTIVNRVAVYIDGEYLGDLQLIEDVVSVAKETFEAKKSLIYLRTVARAVVKGLVAHNAKKDADKKKGGWLAKLAIDVVTDVSENADLRCSRLLPGKVLVGDFEIKPGTYNIQINFLDASGTAVKSTTILDYKVIPRALNMVEAFSLN